MENTLHFQGHGGLYPMIQQRVDDNTIDFVHNEPVTTDMKTTSSLYSFLHERMIFKIVDSQPPKGKHKDKNAVWYRVQFI